MSVVFLEMDKETNEVKVLAECSKEKAVYARSAFKQVMGNFMPEMLRHKKSSDKRVQVMEVDYTIYRKFMKKDDDPAQGLGEPNKVFESAAAASAWIGCKNNEVANALGKARRVGRREATVRGITFSYVSDLPE